MLIGIGLMYATQVVFVLLVVPYLMPASRPIEFHNLIAYLGYTLAAFFIGGCVIGLMAEKVLIVEPTMAAISALVLDLIFTQAGLLKATGVFLFSLAVQAGEYRVALVTVAIAIVAAVGGALMGERRNVPQEDWVSQGLLAIGLAGLLLGPFFLLGIYLPAAYLFIVGTALLAGILMAAYRFGKVSHEIEEISIRPTIPVPAVS
jgi:hypothetical protein